MISRGKFDVRPHEEFRPSTGSPAAKGEVVQAKHRRTITFIAVIWMACAAVGVFLAGPGGRSGSGPASLRSQNASEDISSLPGAVMQAVAGPLATVLSPPSTTTTTAPSSTRTTTPASTTTTTTPAPTTTTTPPAPTTPAPTTTTTTAPSSLSATTGTLDSAEPSGVSPPSANALPGYSQTYVSDFSGTSIPAGWTTYTGQPGGDPGAQFDSAHDVVSGGMLQLNAFQDSAYNNEWVTGGICNCGHSQTYGAYFVRSRVTGAGPTAVELLWPANDSWPPEIDFNETTGVTNVTTATVHSGSSNNMDTKTLSNINMTQWHTWGVIWTPTSITYTVDGQTWATVTVSSEIPNLPMTLDLQQQTWCASGWACPTSPQSMDVDWVAEYAPN
jgi:Glycosyl hydrolases family 16